MNKYTIIILTIILSLMGSTAAAQEQTGNAYDKALEQYNLGRFETACDILLPRIKELSNQERVRAYRILALSSLYMGDTQAAEGYARELLTLDPYYTVYNDSQRFADLIELVKRGKKATITTASRTAESLDEVPVPVTLITAEMIENSGARNLKELLCTYVPSMTNVESNDETNMAMRGLYSSSQEVLLIMVNGHRLNSYSTNAARPDFSISLEKIKQVEVLRGPASSLYGGVALAGVVNIITKDGIEQDGITAHATIGNYGQKKGGFLFGKHLFNTDIMAWATIYNATGEKYYQEPEYPSDAYNYVVIGGFNQRPSYDYGLTLKYGGFSMMLNNSFSKTVSQFCIMSSPYDYERYGIMDGNKPGFFTANTHVNLAYEHSFSPCFSIKATATYDRGDNYHYQVSGDNWSVVPYPLPIYWPDGKPVYLGDYAFQMAKWKDDTFGMLLQGSYSYTAGNHSGELVAGVQLLSTEVSESYYAEGDSCNHIAYTYPVDKKGILGGSEVLFNAFVQYRHSISKRFIINAGIRYDSKQHTFYDAIREWSPRLSLVYYKPTWSAKLSYSKSFVDASYFCRLNTFDTTVGDPSLNPEYQYSWQATFTKHWTPAFTTELTSFYNHTSNIVISYDYMYVNAGNLENAGLELSSSYTSKKWMANLSASYQAPLSHLDYTANSTRVYNVPNISANLVLTYRPVEQFSISTHLNALGEQTSIRSKMDASGKTSSTYFDIPFHVLWNMHAKYTLSAFTIKADVHNIIGNHYLQGGGFLLPLYQQGRWFTFGVEVSL